MKKIVNGVLIIVLSFFLCGCLGNGFKDNGPIDYSKVAEDTAVVELDADSNGGVDIGKGGTNAVTEAAARTALGTDVFNNITSADGASSLNLGAYNHLWTLGTNGSFRIGDAADYFLFSYDGTDFLFSLVDGGSDGNISMQTGTITVADEGIALKTGTSAADWFGIASYDLNGTAYKSILKFFADNAPYLLFGDGTTNVIKILETGLMTFEGTASIDLPTDSVDYANTTGSFKSLTPVTDDADNFAANFTGANLYGGTFIANGTGTAQLPAIGTGGMNFTIITLGAIAIVVEPNASDSFLLDGVQLDDADSATNLSTAGDIIVFQYYSVAGWVATSNGWTDED